MFFFRKEELSQTLKPFIVTDEYFVNATYVAFENLMGYFTLKWSDCIAYIVWLWELQYRYLNFGFGFFKK